MIRDMIGHRVEGFYYAPDAVPSGGGNSLLQRLDQAVSQREYSEDDKKRLRQLKAKLEEAVVRDERQRATLSPYIQRINEIIGLDLDEIIGEVDEQLLQPAQAIRTNREALKTPEDFDIEMEKYWNKILTNVKATNHEVNKEYAEAIRDLLQRKPYPDVASRDHESKRWELIFTIWNAYLATYDNASITDTEWKLIWVDVMSSRATVASILKTEKMWEFIEMPEIRPIMDFMERTMADRVYFGEKDVVVDGVTKRVMLSWDYARDGDPTQQKIDLGIKPLKQYVEENIENGTIRMADGGRIKNLNSITNAAIEMAIIGELRMKYYMRRHAQYLASPVQFDARPVEEVAPLAWIDYKLRSIGKLPTGYQNVAMILRHPKRGRVYTESATGKNNRDVHNYGANWPGEFVPKDVPDRAHAEVLNGEPDVKANPNTAVANKHVAEFVETRGYLAQLLTAADKTLTPVFVPEDLVLTLPPMWDVLTMREYRGLTFKTYMELSNAWLDIQKLTSQVAPRVENLSSIENYVTDMVSKISAYKGIFDVFKAGTPRGDNLRLFLRELFLLFLKRIYDSYSNLNVRASFNPARPIATQTSVFLDTVIEALERATTLEPTIRSGLLGILREEKKKHIEQGLFSRLQGLPYPMVNFVEADRRKRLVAQYTKEESPDEKKK